LRDSAYSLLVMYRFTQLTLFGVCLTLMMQPRPASASELTAGSPCALIEGLPGPKAPIRRVRTLRSTLKAIDNIKATPKQMSAYYDQLEKVVQSALGDASAVFHDTPRREWRESDQKRAKRYLEKHVLGKHPLLQIGTLGLEPRLEVRAAMMYAACRGGRPEAAIRWGRRATRKEEAPSRAFAALLLLDAERHEEAKELLDTIRGPSFLTAWIRAELAEDPKERLRQRASARRRVTTGAQQDAVAAQERRAEQAVP